MGGSILAGKDRVNLDNGMELRLLSALEVMQARREAAQLTGEDREKALCSNACLLARALEQGGSPLFADGRAVLAALTVEEIAALSARWAELRRENDPGLELSGEELEKLKKNSAPTPVSGCGGGC